MQKLVINKENVLNLLKMWNEGISVREIATKFGATVANISYVIFRLRKAGIEFKSRPKGITSVYGSDFKKLVEEVKLSLAENK